MTIPVSFTAPIVGATYVSAFGAAGDGVTDDTLAMRAAIAAAGVGGFLVFIPGKTYLLSGSITPLQGQTFWGYGAKVKRCNAITTTTTGAISTGSGATNIAVSSSASFRVGMDVAVWQSSSVYDIATHRIIAIPDATHVTVGTAFTQALNSGSTVTTAFSQIYESGVADFRVLGLEFDGNRANNTGIAKWYWHNEVCSTGDRALVRDCYIHDAVSEGIQLGGNGSMAHNNYITICGGNGIHFAGSQGGKAVGNYVYDVTKLGSATDHADGCIIFSDSTGDSMITNNYCDTGISGVASIDTSDNASVVISGNIIKNCTTTAIEGTFPSNTTSGKVTITGNLIYSSVKIDINYTPGTYSSTTGGHNWVVSGNYLQSTVINLTGSGAVSVTGNILRLPSDTTNNGVTISQCENVVVASNEIHEGSNAVYMNGASLLNIKVTGNLCRNQYIGAINVQSAARACSVEGNTIVVESGFTTNSGYFGITLANDNFCTGNNLDLQVTAVGTPYGIVCPNGGASQNGALVTNNIIRSSNLTASIRASGGSVNNIVTNNMVQQAVSNGGTNTFSGNTTIF
jgi:hypothetical protein